MMKGRGSEAFRNWPGWTFVVVFVFLDLDLSTSCCVDDLADFIEATGFVEAEDGCVACWGVSHICRMVGMEAYRGVQI